MYIYFVFLRRVCVCVCVCVCVVLAQEKAILERELAQTGLGISPDRNGNQPRLEWDPQTKMFVSVFDIHL